MNLPSIKELISSTSNFGNEARGPERYTVKATVNLIQSNARLEGAIKGFEKSAENSEKRIRDIAWIGILVAIAQFVLAIVIGFRG